MNKSWESGQAVENINNVRRSIFASCEMRTLVMGFESTGIWSTNINVFKEDDFLPAATTDISIVEAPATAPEDSELNFSPQTPQCT